MASRHLLGTSGSWIGPARTVFGRTRWLQQVERAPQRSVACLDQQGLRSRVRDAPEDG
jgi:hypothetical protein